MLKKIVFAFGLTGALLFAGVAYSSTNQYTGNFCDPTFGTTTSWTKGQNFGVGSSWMDLVCPLVSTSTNNFTITRIRVHTGYPNGGGSCTFYTRTAYGSQVAAVTQQLSTTPNIDQTLNFGAVSFTNAQ